MNRRLAVAIIILFSLPLFAHADDASKMAKIHEFFKVAKIDQLTNQTMQRISDQMKSGVIERMFGVKLTAEQQQKANELSDKMMKILSSELSWDTLEPEYAKMYADAYTEQQIDDLIAFYKSPTGQIMVEKTPILMQQANALAEQRVASAMPQIQQLLMDYMKEATTTSPPEKPKQ